MPEVQEKVEQIAKESYMNMVAFIKRCIETIDFLDMITCDGDIGQFTLLQ